jgi:hypothetical protein
MMHRGAICPSVTLIASPSQPSGEENAFELPRSIVANQSNYELRNKWQINTRITSLMANHMLKRPIHTQ